MGKTLAIALLASSFIAGAFANCKAVGQLYTNSIPGGGDGGATDIMSVNVTLYQNGKAIGSYQDGNGNSPCGTADYTDPCDIDSSLPAVVTWFGTCTTPSWGGCKLNYGSQVDVIGTVQPVSFNYYGIGVSTVDDCFIEFDC